MRIVSVAALIVMSCYGTVCADDFFEQHIRPLLLDRCAGCHGEEKQEAGLRIDSAKALYRGSESGAVVVPGSPDESRLIALVRGTDDLQMHRTLGCRKPRSVTSKSG